MSYTTARGNFKEDVLKEASMTLQTMGDKNMAYILRTPTGTFTIEPDECTSDTFKLCVGGLWLASYQTPDDASTAVTKRQTGWPDWDRCAPGGECPACLTDWEEC